MTGAETKAFALDGTYVRLSDGADAIPIPVGADFWERIGERAELQGGRLLMLFHVTKRNLHWEMHPAGDEILCLISGAMSVVLDEGKARQRKVRLKPGEAFIVPRGVWHTFEIEQDGDLLAITRGAGTEHR